MMLRKKEQFICYMVVVILFLTGMCVEISPADTVFSYTNAEIVSDDSITVIRDVSKLITFEPICTIETLGRNTAIVLSGNRGRIQVRRFLRNIAVLLAVPVLLSHLFHYGDIADLASCKMISSHAVIVRYIQQKDGKK